jgi:WD40 repeat protein
LVLHDIKAKKQVANIRLENSDLHSLADAGKYLVFGHGRGHPQEKRDGQITILDAETGKVTGQVTITPTAKMPPRQLPLAISADGARLAWADDDVAVLYDVKAAKVLHRLEGHLDAVGAITFSPNGDFLVTSAKDKTVRFWSTATGKFIHTIKKLPAAISAIVLAPDGKRILTVSGDSRNPADVRGEIRNFDLK